MQIFNLSVHHKQQSIVRVSKNATPASSCRESYLRNAVIMGHYPHYVIQGQQWIALDLCVHVLPLGAGGQQFHQGDVIRQGPALVGSVSLRAHHLQQDWEGCSVVVEYQHIFTAIYQLRKGSQGFEHPALQLFWMTLKVFSTLNDSMIFLVSYFKYAKTLQLKPKQWNKIYSDVVCQMNMSKQYPRQTSALINISTNLE